MQRQLAEFMQAVQRARELDQQATLALCKSLQEQHAADHFLLRQDLETVASLTDDEMRQARQRLMQLAALTQPISKPVEPSNP